MLKSINMSDSECKDIINVNDKNDTNNTNDTNDSKDDKNIKDKINSETSLDSLLLDLKIISNIKEFDKISIKENIEIDTPHFLQSVSRKINGDSRERTIKYISEVINNIFTILDELLKKEMKTELTSSQHYYSKKEKYNFKSETVSIYQTISQNLTESIAGLQNLKITYLNDITTTAKIDMLIIKIQNRISKINNMMIINPVY